MTWMPEGVTELVVSRTLADGTVETGGRARMVSLNGEVFVEDFRDRHGRRWSLPPGAHFDIALPLQPGDDPPPLRWWRRLFLSPPDRRRQWHLRLLDSLPWR